MSNSMKKRKGKNIKTKNHTPSYQPINNMYLTYNIKMAHHY